MKLEPFRVLIVCTANQCRSPLMEFALRRRCRALGLRWVVISAGTLARPDRPAHLYTQQLLLEHGDDGGSWRSRQPSEELIESSDLLLTATLENRSQILRVWPKAARRTFPLLQLAEFWGRQQTLRDTDGSRAATTRRVDEARRALPPIALESDLLDPMGRTMRVFRRVDRQIETAMDNLLSGWSGSAQERGGNVNPWI